MWHKYSNKLRVTKVAHQSENSLWVPLAHGCGRDLLQTSDPLRVVAVQLGVPLAASEFDLRALRA
jgi:hypothetical protein